jgi:hypothetical protein
VRWSPADGVWLQLTAPLDEPTLLSLAAAVRLDRALRCGPSFRLASPPPALQWQGCNLQFNQGTVDMMMVNATSAAGPFGFITYNARRYPAWPSSESPGAPVTATVNGRQALVSHEGKTVELRNGDARWVMSSPDKSWADMLAATVVLGDLDPLTWPPYGG